MKIIVSKGACVTGDSLITLLDGSQRTIKDIVEKQDITELPCIDIDNECMTVGKVTQFCDVGFKKTIKITTNTGKSIEGTYEHPVLIYKDNKIQWERLDKIKIKDKICVPSATPYFGTYNEPYARVLGMFIGDGSYGNKQTPSFYNADDELWDYLYDKFKDDVVYEKSKSHTTKQNKMYRQAYIKNTIPIFKKAGIYGQTQQNKSLPSNWQNYDEKSLKELVGGLFDTDGYVINASNNCYQVRFCSSCRRIIDDLQAILLKFGIHSSIVTSKKQGGQVQIDNRIVNCNYINYELLVMGKYNVTLFANTFKLLVREKQDRLNKAVMSYSKKQDRSRRFKYNDDIYFETVKNIEYGENNVYDLTVENYHSFIANGMFVHNTNAKMIKIGTPRTRNHFYQSFQSDDNSQTAWTKIRRDWTRCPQLWALDKTMLPDKDTGIIRPYSTYVLSLMPKALKQEYFPNNPEVWYEGDMSVEDFKTQYMLEFIDGAGKFFGQADFDRMRDGKFDWLHHGQFGETYFAGIDFAGSGAATADYTHITVLRVAPNGVKQKIYAIEMHGVSYPEQIRTIVRMFYGREAQFHCQSIFADYTGVGRPVIDSLIYDYGLTNLTGITFNARDTFTNSGMNLKNVMFAKLRQDVENDLFKYPDKDHFIKSAGSEKNGFYHKMLGEWSDLEQETRSTVNKIIQAPTGGHDDVCCADVLANFASIVGTQQHTQKMPKASKGNFTRIR